MKLKAIYTVLLASSLTACSNEKAPENEPKQEVEQAVAPVKEETTSDVTSITGRVEVSPNACISVHAPIASFVEDIPVKVGDKIAKGQVLAYIQHPDILKLQEDYLTAKSDYEVELENFGRKKDLYTSKSISRKEFLESKKVYASSKARLDRLSAELRFTGINTDAVQKGIVSRIAVKSPSNGIVSSVQTNKGKFMSATDEMMTVLDTKDKWIVFQVFADQLSLMEIGDTLSFHTSGMENKAIVESISAELSSTTRGLQVICKPLTQEGLNIGEIAYGKITTKR